MTINNIKTRCLHIKVATIVCFFNRDLNLKAFKLWKYSGWVHVKLYGIIMPCVPKSFLPSDLSMQFRAWLSCLIPWFGGLRPELSSSGTDTNPGTQERGKHIISRSTIHSLPTLNDQTLWISPNCLKIKHQHYILFPYCRNQDNCW